MSEFDQAAKAAGFTDDQIEFMQEWLSLNGHRHDIDEVEGLTSALEGLDCDDDDEEGDDDE